MKRKPMKYDFIIEKKYHDSVTTHKIVVDFDSDPEQGSDTVLIKHFSSEISEPDTLCLFVDELKDLRLMIDAVLQHHSQVNA
jgi:hypothetical protein